MGCQTFSKMLYSPSIDSEIPVACTGCGANLYEAIVFNQEVDIIRKAKNCRGEFGSYVSWAVGAPGDAG